MLVIVTVNNLKRIITRLDLLNHLNLSTDATAPETLRGESLRFKAFYKAYKFIDPNFLTWLIGFFEGDGSLSLDTL